MTSAPTNPSKSFMNVLQLISSAGFYGAENVVLELASELKTLGINCTLGVFNNLRNPHLELTQFGKAREIQTHLFDCRGQADWRTLVQLGRYLRSERIDLVHTHGYKSNLYGLAVSRFMGKPSISTCHNWISNDLKTQAYYLIDKTILPRFSHVVGVSSKIVDELLRIHVPAKKVSMISNGINLSRFAAEGSNLRAEFKIGPFESVVGVVARMTPEKGLIHLIEAAKSVLQEMPGTRFLLVGDGPLRNELEKKVAQLEISSQVLFVGPRQDMPEVYRTLDFFVLPSLNEGLPMALLEAMASSRAVVVTGVGEIPQLIRPSQEGLLIPPGDSRAISTALTQLMHNRNLSSTLARNALARVTELCSSRRMCEQYLKLYTELHRRSRNTPGSLKAERGGK
ncbi:MAG: glycosyltransferase family 4 protein [Terriglobia bacterium]